VNNADNTDQVEIYVLDSFALLAHLEDEERGVKVTEILKNAQQAENIILYVSVVNLGEVYYITMRERGEVKAEEVLALIKMLPIQIINVDLDLTLKASRLKSKYPVAYADCFAAALATEKNAKVITGDPEFNEMEEEIRIEWI
jgi:ribonuclease VapC